MVAFPFTVLGCTALLASTISIVTASHSVDTAAVIRARQAVYNKHEPRAHMVKRYTAALNSFQDLHRTGSGYAKSLSSECDAPKHGSNNDRPNHGHLINHYIHSCTTAVKKCGGGSPPVSVPSQGPGGPSPTGPTCAAIAGVYADLVTILQLAVQEVFDLLVEIPELRETILATAEELAAELLYLLQDTNDSIPGLTELVATYTQHNPSGPSDALGGFFASL